MNMYYGLHMEDQEEYEATMCPTCDTHKKEDGENECKFCWRIGKFASSIINGSKPLHRSLDLMDQRGQYE